MQTPQIRSQNPDAKTPARIAELRRRVAVDAISKSAGESAIRSSLLRPKFDDRQRWFFAIDRQGDSLTRASLVARVSETLTDLDNKPIGMLGFFDSENDPETAIALIDQATNWLDAQGCNSVIGPIDGDTWHKYRINVGPFTDQPFLLEPTNPKYYANLFRAAGFEVIDRYHSLRVDDINSILPTTKPAADVARDSGYRFRPLRLDRFDDELKIIHSLSIESFRENFLYDDISWEDFRVMYWDARSLIRPELVWFAEDQSGNEVGFLFCLIDYFRSVAAMKGRNSFLSKLKFLFNRSRAEAVNFKSIAVLPEHRRSKIGGALMYHGYRESLSLGFAKANLCLIRDGNPSSRLDGGNSRVMRRYELYQSHGSRLKPVN